MDTEIGTRAVQNRDIDIALVRRANGGPGYRAVPLRHDHFVAAVPLDHLPWAVGHPLDLSELATQGSSADAGHQANSVATPLVMVACGFGVAIVPSVTTHSRRDLASRDLRDPSPLVALSLLVHKDLDPVVEHFVTPVSQALLGTAKPNANSPIDCPPPVDDAPPESAQRRHRRQVAFKS